MLSQTLIKYSRLFFPNIDKDSIKIFLESSPQYPSLMSVLQSLRYTGLDAQAGQCDWDYLKNLNRPFLLHIKYKDQENLVIAKWDTKLKKIKWYNLKKDRWNIKGEENLKDYWDGIVIYVNNQTINTCIILQESIILSVILTIIIFAIGCLCILKINVINYTPILLGCVVSGGLYFKSEIRSSLIDKLCRVSKVTDCERIEYSSYGSLFGFDMCCLAFSFFASQLICLGIEYILGISDTIHTLYFISTVVLFPVIAYSIYGQFKIGKICPLCILILLCIVTEFVIYINDVQSGIRLDVIIFYGCIFLIKVDLFQYILNFKKKEVIHQMEKIEFLKLKRKKVVLQSESIPVNVSQSYIWFGEEDSMFTITTIISPNCIHCRQVVLEFINILRVGVKFRWNIILGETTPIDSDIINTWIQRYHDDKKSLYEEMYLWSIGKVAQIQKLKCETVVESAFISDIKHSFEKTIFDVNISGFPRIILNKRLLSTIYKPWDIGLVIADQNIY